MTPGHRPGAVDSMQHQTRLLDLPDGPLMNILRYLGDPGPHSTCAFRNGRAMFAVATTCTRLSGLVSQVLGLDTVDVLTPNCYERGPRKRFEKRSPAQIRAVTCLAGENLRVLRLPEGCACPQLILEGLTRRCPRLRELAFPDSGFLGEDLEHSLFSSASFITSVYIFDPRSVLRSLASCKHLRELTLTGVKAECVDLLMSLLRLSGKWLHFLRVGFNAKKEVLEDALDDAPEYAAEEDPSMSSVSRLADYLCERLRLDLPALITLDIASALTTDMEHLCDPEGNNVVETIIDVANRVSWAKGRNTRAPQTVSLRTITIRTTEGKAIHCINPFGPLMAGCVNVEVQFPGTVLAFPSQGGAEALHFKALQITTSCLQNYLSLWSSELRTLETLDVGTTKMAEQYCTDQSTREKVDRIVKMAGSHLRELRVATTPASLYQVWDTCRYVADVLQAAPSITTVQIPVAIIRCDDNHEYRRMIDSLRQVHVLRITTQEASNAHLLQEALRLDVRQGIPVFLDALSLCNLKLQTILLERCLPLWGDGLQSGSRSLRRAFRDAVGRFKTLYPHIDVTSIQALCPADLYTP